MSYSILISPYYIELRLWEVHNKSTLISSIILAMRDMSRGLEQSLRYKEVQSVSKMTGLLGLCKAWWLTASHAARASASSASLHFLIIRDAVNNTLPCSPLATIPADSSPEWGRKVPSKLIFSQPTMGLDHTNPLHVVSAPCSVCKNSSTCLSRNSTQAITEISMG